MNIDPESFGQIHPDIPCPGLSQQGDIVMIVHPAPETRHELSEASRAYLEWYARRAFSQRSIDTMSEARFQVLPNIIVDVRNGDLYLFKVETLPSFLHLGSSATCSLCHS